MKHKFQLIRTVQHNGLIFEPPTTIELSEDEAQSLLEIGVIQPVGAIEKPDEPPALEQEDEAIVVMDNLSIAAATTLIEKTTDLAQLHIYKEDEVTGKARKAVLSAIDKQISSQAN
jgi:hypothetical protein